MRERPWSKEVLLKSFLLPGTENHKLLGGWGRTTTTSTPFISKIRAHFSLYSWCLCFTILKIGLNIRKKCSTCLINEWSNTVWWHYPHENGQIWESRHCVSRSLLHSLHQYFENSDWCRYMNTSNRLFGVFLSYGRVMAQKLPKSNAFIKCIFSLRV